MTKRGILVIAVYSHIEAYPPSLNAVYHLAGLFERIIILVPNVMKSKWNYPDNVQLLAFGDYMDVRETGKKSVLAKFIYFLKYGIYLKRVVTGNKANLVLTYDPSTFSLLNLFSWSYLKRNKIPVWYHNHDVMNERELPRFSLMRLGRKLELLYFARIALFSLPNTVRLAFFPIHRLKRQPVILPNYPSKYVYGKHYTVKDISGEVIKLIFQGHISSTGSFETFIRILKYAINGKRLELHLAGPVDPSYLESLCALAKEINVSDQLIIHGLMPYGNLPELTNHCHIGIAVYGEHNTMVKTMSTASNKIFEYASLGLPVIINKRSDMVSEFSPYPWIHFSEINDEAVVDCLQRIAANYNYYSTLARTDFETTLNYEANFKTVLDIIDKNLLK